MKIKMKLMLFFVLSIFLVLKEVRSATHQKQTQLIEEEWETFKNMYNKVYSSKLEENFRMKIYMENRLKIAQHNRKDSSYKLAMNQFGDLLGHEISKINGNRKNLQNATAGLGGTFLPPENFKAPDHVDWRDHDFVTSVKNQGICDSDWSFAAIGALEGQMKRKTGKLVPLSAQNLLDCSRTNFGCEGGFPNPAFVDIKLSKGIDTEISYPYEGKRGDCRFSEASVAATVVGFNNIPLNDEEALKLAVASIGPISITVNAYDFDFYHSGIYIDNDCDPDDAMSFMLVVGYGTENGQDYWLIKNSWGTDWGEKGYMRMARNNKNQCGIASLASYPLV